MKQEEAEYEFEGELLQYHTLITNNKIHFTVRIKRNRGPNKTRIGVCGMRKALSNLYGKKNKREIILLIGKEE